MTYIVSGGALNSTHSLTRWEAWGRDPWSLFKSMPVYASTYDTYSNHCKKQILTTFYDELMKCCINGGGVLRMLQFLGGPQLAGV